MKLEEGCVHTIEIMVWRLLKKRIDSILNYFDYNNMYMYEFRYFINTLNKF